MALLCEQIGCATTAHYRLSWPTGRTTFVCSTHAQLLFAAAHGMGFQVRIVPLVDGPPPNPRALEEELAGRDLEALEREAGWR